MVSLADAIHPLHEDAVCSHLLASHDCVRIPACVHAIMLQSWGGGPRCACCGRHCPAAGVQRGLHCGPFFRHLCCFKALSVAPYLGAVIGTLLACCVPQCWNEFVLQSFPDLQMPALVLAFECFCLWMFHVLCSVQTFVLFLGYVHPAPLA